MQKAYQQLIQSVVEFAGLLRKAGIDVGSNAIIKTTQAITLVQINRHKDLYWTLKACLISDHLQEEIFNQLFALYWGHARLPDSALAVSLPRSKFKSKGEKSFSRRALDAFDKKQAEPIEQKIEIEKLQLSWSDQQRITQMDFESMSAQDYLQAQKLLLKIKLGFKPVKSHRFKRTTQVSKIDFRTSMRKSCKYNAELIELNYKKHKQYYPSLVLLIDISGSMSRYAQIMLRFAHLLNQARTNVHVFLFATRLTPISIELDQREMDESLARIGEHVHDWNNGTRIGSCVKYFNNKYLRRIVNSKSEVFFVTDGLDRGDQALLDRQLSRISRTCKKLIWLNPLMRYDRYEPTARGASVLYRHADQMLSVHNLVSLRQLIEILFSNANARHQAA